MIKVSPLQAVVLSKLEKQVPASDVLPGDYEFDFTVRIKGKATRSADTEKTPSARALSLETLALFIQRAGIQREKAIEILMEVMRDNVERGDDQKAALLKITGVADATVRLKNELAKLPKTPVKGQFRFKNIDVMGADADVLGDEHIPHADDADQPDQPEIPVIEAI